MMPKATAAGRVSMLLISSARLRDCAAPASSPDRRARERAGRLQNGTFNASSLYKPGAAGRPPATQKLRASQSLPFVGPLDPYQPHSLNFVATTSDASTLSGTGRPESTGVNTRFRRALVHEA